MLDLLALRKVEQNLEIFCAQRPCNQPSGKWCPAKVNNSTIFPREYSAIDKYFRQAVSWQGFFALKAGGNNISDSYTEMVDLIFKMDTLLTMTALLGYPVDLTVW